jgi:hypothetical protein
VTATRPGSPAAVVVALNSYIFCQRPPAGRRAKPSATLIDVVVVVVVDVFVKTAVLYRVNAAADRNHYTSGGLCF